MVGFDAGDFVTITVAWDDLDTDDADANPADLNALHASCVDDDRFFSARVVRLDADGGRTYWKLDGKDPGSVTVEIGDAADVVHVLLVPTPPADYVDDEERVYDTFEPVPCYGYAYEVAVADAGSETASAAVAYGVLAYADAGDWFETRCTCTTLADDLSDCWAPQFAAADHPPTPTQEPTEGSEPVAAPTARPTRAPGEPVAAPTARPTRDPTREPTSRPTHAPGEPAPAPTSDPTREPTKDAGDVCVDDPMGVVADLRGDVDAACAGIVEDGCDDFQADYNGYELYTWQLCPLSCGRCGDYEDPACVSDSGCCCEPRGCFDDPLGIIADLGPAVGEACAGIADDGCDDFQADYNGYELYTWQLCPRSCDRCEDYEDPVCAADEGCCCDAPGEPTSRPTRAPPAPEPTDPAGNDDGEPCADSTSWYWKKSKNTCEDYARARVPRSF